MAYELSANLIKPDGLTRGLIGKIITRFEEKGLTLVDMKYMRMTDEQVRMFYADKADSDIFDEIRAYLVNQPIIAMAWAGEDASTKGRLLVGDKDPDKSDPGSIRGAMAQDRVRSLVHGSRTGAEAMNELMILFPERWEGTPVPADDRPAADAPKVAPTALGLDQEDEDWRFPLAMVAKGGEWEEE